MMGSRQWRKKWHELQAERGSKLSEEQRMLQQQQRDASL
jgi:hypothetical protein